MPQTLNLKNWHFQMDMGIGGDAFRLCGTCPEMNDRPIMPSTPKDIEEFTNHFVVTTQSDNRYILFKNDCDGDFETQKKYLYEALEHGYLVK